MHNRSGLTFLIVLCVAPMTFAQALPDLIVADIPSTWNWGSANNIAAFSCGTNACNIGNAAMPWAGPTNQHPIIAENMFRLKGNRIEQLGQAWVKHGFASLNGNYCGTCVDPGTDQMCGILCSDPYGNQQNGIQTDLAPKSEVNAATGYFPYPWNSAPAIPPTTGRRLQAAHSDLDPVLNAGAIYFIEVHYVTPNDVAGAKNHNNASYRRVNVTPTASSYNISFSGTYPTQAQKPAIQAWKDLNPSVVITNVDIPNDGRLILAFLATDNGNGTTHYEYALHNLNSDRSVQAFSVSLPAGAVVSNAGFHDVNYHSNEPAGYSLTDWTPTVSAASVSWATDTYAVNPAANALRWGTLYNFRFDSTLPPGDITLSLFKPGTPTSVVVPSPLPAFSLAVAGGTPAAMEPDAPLPVTITATNLAGQPDPSSGLLYASVNNGPFVPSALTNLGGNFFSGTLPAAPCFQTVRWYVTMNPLGGGSTVTGPLNAPATTYATEAVSAVVGTLFSDDMETVVPGWAVTNVMGPAADGQWNTAPGIPIGGGDRGDPATAFGGSGKCFLTDNVDGDSDVDDGETRLDSPAFNLSGYTDARVRVQIWYDNVFSAGSNDSMTVQISNNNGASWTTMETFSAVQHWVEHKYRVAQFIAPSTQMKVRFVASDYAPGHVVEAAVDSFKVEVCPVAPYLGLAGVGNVGATAGGPYNTLTVNGSTGGFSRRVNVGIGQAVSFAVTQPPGNVVPANFAVFGTLGTSGPTASYALPIGIGDMCFAPCPLDPLNPALFMLTDNFPIGGCTPALPSTAAPWSITVPGGVGFPIDVTLQAVTEDTTAPTGLAVTNGVILRIL